MGNVPFASAQRFATLLSASIKGVAFYPEAHPAVVQPLQQLISLCDGFLRTEPEINLGVMDGLLFFEEHLFINPPTALGELAQILTDREIERITVQRGVRLDELTRFVSLLGRKNPATGLLAEEMERGGIRHIRLQQLERAEEEGEDAEGPGKGLGMYNEALDAVRNAFREMEQGRIPSGTRLFAAVDEMVSMTILDPSALLGLTMIKDYDNYTFNHSVNVGILAMSLGAALALGKEDLKELGIAGLLHDIGKTKIAKSVLNKPGKLTAEEFAEMKRHPENGARIIGTMEGVAPRVADAVLGHHIQHNRQGYPEWAKERSFGDLCDILAVADCYDALTTLRVYQRPFTPKAAIERLRELSGTLYDGPLVEKFAEMMGDYPVGTVVRLDTNEIAVVVKGNPGDQSLPTVKVIIDGQGRTLDEPRLERLAGEDGGRYASIVAVIDPLLKNIDVARYLT